MVADFGEQDEIVLAYACSIHKSQGSEFPAAVVPLATQHYPTLERNLLYTAVTRGKRLVVVIGQPQALVIAPSRRPGGSSASRNACPVEALSGTLMKRLVAILAYTLLPLGYAVGGSFDHTPRAWTELLRQHVVLIDGGSGVRCGFTAGRNDWTIRLTDAAGNFSMATRDLRMRPVLFSVTPNLIDFRLAGAQMIVLTGAGLRQFPTDPKNVVLIDGRVVSAAVTSSSGPPETLALTLPITANPGPIGVRIEGLDSSRPTPQICRDEAAKFVADVPIDSIFNVAMERGPIGQPMFAWVEDQAVQRRDAVGNLYSEISIPDAMAKAGDPVELLRMPDGQVATVWITGPTGPSNAIKLEARFSGSSVSTTFPAFEGTEQPRDLKVAIDPSTGLPSVLVISRFVFPPEVLASAPPPRGGEPRAPRPPPQVLARLFTLDPASGLSTSKIIGRFAVDKHPSFSGGLALGPAGSGWILVSGSTTRVFARSGSTWVSAGSLPGYVASATAALDGGTFHAVFYCAGSRNPALHGCDPSFLGASPIEGSVRYMSVPAGSTSWSEGWRQGLTIRPEALRPPNSDKPLPDIARLLAHAASIGLTSAGTPRIAFMNAEHGTLHLLVRPPVVSGRLSTPPLVDFLDVDVVLGQSTNIALDKDDEALVGYVDLSQTLPLLASPGPDQPPLLASVQLVETKNHNQVVPSSIQMPSRCSPSKFPRAFISAANWDAIRADQASRLPFKFSDLTNAFTPFSTLGAKQGSAALLSRLLREGGISIAARAATAGDPLINTVDNNALVLPDEVRGLRVPVGMSGALVTTFTTPDEEINQIHLARFKPLEFLHDGPGCSDRPTPRIGAAMAFDTTSNVFVMFGGEDRDVNGNRRLPTATWVLRFRPPLGRYCWEQVALHAAFPPPPGMVGHVMTTAPRGRGVLLFGGNEENPSVPGTKRSETWTFDYSSKRWAPRSAASVPDPRSGSSVVFDAARERTWLFGGEGETARLNDLWFLEVQTSPEGIDSYHWIAATAGGTAPEARSQAGLALDQTRDQLLVFGGIDGGDPRNDLYAFEIEAGGAIDGKWLPALFANDPRTPSDAGTAMFRGRAVRGPTAVVSRQWDKLAIFGGERLTFGWLGIPTIAPLPSRSIEFYDPSSVAVAAWDVAVREAVPPPRKDHAWAYDEGRDQIVVFGGSDGTQFLNDTIAFSFAGAPDDPEPRGEWISLVPGEAETADLLLLQGGTPGKQWGRAESAALLAIPAAAEIVTGLSGDAETPPIRKAAPVEFRIDQYELGTIRFTKFFEDKGVVGGQGQLWSKADLGSFTAKGRLISPGLDFVATTRIPDNPFAGCTIFLKKNMRDCRPFSCNPPDMRAAVAVQASVDNHPLEAPRRSHPNLVGATVASSINVRTKVPICIKLSSNGVFVPNIELGVLFPNFRVSVFSTVLATLLEVGIIGRLVGDPVGDKLGGAVGDGPLGTLDELAGAITVDAFTNFRYRDLRSGTFFAESDELFVFDAPEWILVDTAGVTLSLRRTPGIQGPLPPHIP